MKRIWKIILITLGSILLISLILGGWGWSYMNNNFLSFEEDYELQTDLKEQTINGYTFVDRNGNGTLDIYEDTRRSVQERAADLLSQMTLDEKLHLLKGSGIASAMGMAGEGGIPGAVGTIVPTPRLGLPTVYLSDGPAGLRIEPTREGEDRTYYCTAFPIATVLASTWNQDLVYQVGNAMGTEAREYGIDVILGPGANIHRHPFCGRNFEYYSEDPVLTGNIGAAIVNGIESNGVGTAVKHFVANNQETQRDLNDVLVSERAMREIYLKGFEIVVEKAQPWTIMSSYNKVNGTYISQSEYLLTEVLRNHWGFEGLVMTDWFGGRDAVAQVMAGNDLLEPGTKKQWEALIAGQESGALTMEAIDRSVGRILELIIKSHKMNDDAYGNNPDLEAHALITRQSAAEGMVLLKNQGALPLKAAQNIALLGVTSYDFIAGGTGSGDVNEAYSVSLEEGLRNAGFSINQRAREIFEAHREANKEAFVKPEGLDGLFDPYTPPEMSFTAIELEEIVKSSDVGVLTIGRNAGEGGDRVEADDFLLTSVERTMIADASKAFKASGKQLIVVLNIGGVIETSSWNELPDAILLAWQGGQEGGNSVADILAGKVNPSGKLPMTFPVRVSDHASHKNFPLTGEKLTFFKLLKSMLFQREETPDAEKIENVDYTEYEEGVYVGYRHFDKADLTVAYPFGYGLSYSTFDFKDVQVRSENDTIHLSLYVENTGETAGKEVVQVYTRKVDTQIDRPVQELKAFTKTEMIAPGAMASISLSIPVKDLRYWNEETAAWALEEGAYEIRVGTSSRDIKLAEVIDLQ